MRRMLSACKLQFLSLSASHSISHSARSRSRVMMMQPELIPSYGTRNHCLPSFTTLIRGRRHFADYRVKTELAADTRESCVSAEAMEWTWWKTEMQQLSAHSWIAPVIPNCTLVGCSLAIPVVIRFCKEKHGRHSWICGCTTDWTVTLI